jgi:hypothetical protein
MDPNMHRATKDQVASHNGQLIVTISVGESDKGMELLVSSNAPEDIVAAALILAAHQFAPENVFILPSALIVDGE